MSARFGFDVDFKGLSDEELAIAGVGPDMIRLSVGLEDTADLIWDLENGLRAARAVALGAAV